MRELALFRKLRKGFRLLVEGPIALVIVLLVRFLRPMVVIRFRRLVSHRIGHFSLDIEEYLCQRAAGMHDRRSHDIFYHSHPVCNTQLKKMWDRTLHISDSAPPSFYDVLDWLNMRIPGHEYHVVPWKKYPHGHYELLCRYPSHLTFTQDEELLGIRERRRLGIPDGTPFVCFIARDPAYLDTVLGGHWQYHDYRDAHIDNYLPMAEELARRGYYALRMGAVVKEALNTQTPNIIDLATSGRTDFLDIYLFAKCRFMVASTSGPCCLGWAFRTVPICFANVVPLLTASGIRQGQDLFIPKKFWLPEKNRLMTFREIVESSVWRFGRTQDFLDCGIELVENTPDEIMALAVEMDERLKGNWASHEEDEKLQSRFLTILKKSGLPEWVFRMPRMGASFLRDNRALLE